MLPILYMKQLSRKFIIFLTIAMLLFLTGCSGERIQRRIGHREDGIAYMNEEKYEEAINSFQLALDESLGAIDEMTLDICFYKAKAQYLSGNTDDALATYNSIIAYNNHPKAYFLRGNLYYTLGNETEALANYEKAIEFEKADYELYIGIYDILMEKGKEVEAKVYLTKALEITEQSAKDKLQEGRIQFLLGQYEQAIPLLEAASVSEVDANFYLSETYEATGDRANADKYLNSYLQSEKVDSYQLYEVGELQMEDEKYSLAITCFKKALELEKVPNKQQIMKRIVNAYELMYDFTSARRSMAEYIAEYPSDEEALREYTFLQTR